MGLIGRLAKPARRMHVRLPDRPAGGTADRVLPRRGKDEPKGPREGLCRRVKNSWKSER